MDGPNEIDGWFIAKALDRFDSNLPSYQRLAIDLKDAVEERLSGGGLSNFRVETRVKSRASLENKLVKRPRREVEDIVGARVLLFFRSDLMLAEEILQRMLILETGSYVNKAELLGDSEFGYRSVQFVGRTKKEGWDAEPDPLWELAVDGSGQKIEVQIRTVLEHAFAEVEHDIRYKSSSDDLTSEVHRRFALTAAILEQADTNLDDIRSSIGLGLEGFRSSRSSEIQGWDAERFVQASRNSLQLDAQIRTALDVPKAHVSKAEREVTIAASLAGWTRYSQYEEGLRDYGDLGRRLAIACADSAHGLVLIDFEPQHPPIGYPGIGLYWTALAAALAVEDVDPTKLPETISIPIGRMIEFKTVAEFLLANPTVPASSVRDLYRPQAAPAGSTRLKDFSPVHL